MMHNNQLKQFIKEYKYYLCAFVLVVIVYFIYFQMRTVIYKEVIWELGVPFEDVNEVLVKNPTSQTKILSPLESVDSDQVGDYNIQISHKGRLYDCVVKVRDTQAPKAKVKEKTIVINTILNPYTLIYDIEEASSLTIEFDKAYVFDKEKTYSVRIILTDEYQNKTILKTKVHVIDDQESPEVIENPTLYISRGAEDIDYLEGLVLEDNVCDQDDIRISIHDQAVDASSFGEYTVTLKVEDTAGNVRYVKRQVEVTIMALVETNLVLEQMSPELSDSLDRVLEDLIHDDMSERQKLRAVYDWCLTLRYQNNGEQDYLENYYQNMESYASYILSRRTGHCFHYAAIQTYMIHKLGLPVFLIKGEGINTALNYELHFWSVVQLNGTWYHFDPLYEQLFLYNKQFFLSTSSSIYNVTHRWDKTLYPGI